MQQCCSRLQRPWELLKGYALLQCSHSESPHVRAKTIHNRGLSNSDDSKGCGDTSFEQSRLEQQGLDLLEFSNPRPSSIHIGRTREISRTHAQSPKMRLPYTDNPPTGLPEEDQAVVSRVQARRGKMGLIPLDLALLHAPKIADGTVSPAHCPKLQHLTAPLQAGILSSAPSARRTVSRMTSARSSSAASR